MSDPGYTIFDSETGLTILKWAITILVAGFIAQFGKKFATYLIEKIRSIKKRKPETQNNMPAGSVPSQMLPGHGGTAPGPSVQAPGTSDLKYNKKMLKAQAKERKKK